MQRIIALLSPRATCSWNSIATAAILLSLHPPTGKFLLLSLLSTVTCCLATTSPRMLLTASALHAA